MSRSSALRKLADLRRLVDEVARELEADEMTFPAVESKQPIEVSEVDRARARAILRRKGVRV